MAEEKLFTRNFMILIIMGFCFSFAFLSIYICMADYVDDIFGGNATWGGVAACIFVLGAFLSRIFIARYIDVIGRKRSLFISIVMMIIANILYFFVPDFLSLCLLRIFNGFFYGFGMLAINSMVAMFVPASRRSEGIGYYMLSYTLASAIGPYLSMQFLHNGGYDSIFLMTTVVITIPILMVGFLKVDRRIITAEERERIHELKIDNLIERSALRISLVVMVFFFAYSSVLTFVSQYGDSIGLVAATSCFFLVIAASTFISRVFVGKLADMHGENVVLIPCFIMFIVALVILSYADSALMLLVAAFMIGFGVALVNSVGQSIVIRQSRPDRYPICMSTFQIFMDMSSGFGPFVFGTLIVLYGFHDTYLIAAGLGVVSLILYMYLHGFKMMKKESNC